jgi:hypothetical protein
MPQGNKYCAKRWIHAAIHPRNDSAAVSFFALPPELRNKIYTHLLTLTQSGASNKRFCWPQILATCQRINKEAAGILYESNVMNIEIGSRWRYVGRVLLGELDVQRYWAFVLPHDREARFRDYPRTLKYFLGEWPSFLSKAHHLRLDISLTFLCDVRSSHRLHEQPMPADRLVYALCSFLCNGNSLRSLHINVEVDVKPRVITDPLLKRILWPLAKLGKPDILVLDGVSREVANHVLEISKQYKSILKDNLANGQFIARPLSAQLSSIKDEETSPRPTKMSVRRKIAVFQRVWKEYNQELAAIELRK